MASSATKPRSGSPLPRLSPSQARLLQSYFRARCDLFLLAEREHLLVIDLVQWSQSPAVRAHLAALKDLADSSTHLRTSQARLLALDKLEHIVKTTDDPQELRRAASTIYRGGCAMPQPRAPKKPDPDKPPPHYLPSDYRRKWGNLGPGFHPAYKAARPTAHDSFAGAPLSHPPPPGEVPRFAAEGAPSSRSSLPTLREPRTSPSRNNSRRRRARRPRILSRTPARATPIPRKPKPRATPRKPARTPAPPTARPRGPRPVRSRGPSHTPRRRDPKGREPP